MEKIWDELYVAAKQVLRPRRISDRMEAGGVAAAVEAGSGRVYVGVCVDAACSLGVCAERNAIFNMITCGESVLRRVVAVDWDGRALPPCGACRELMAELMPETYKSVEIMLDYEAARVVTLGDLTPEWWF
uniref:cytidine deaminase family protein n=1 Tax=Candidatus Scatomorpha intestinigallinarum TaxID=2840923 RepID=UPI0040294016